MGRTSRILVVIGLWITSIVAVVGVLPATTGVAAAESVRSAASSDTAAVIGEPSESIVDESCPEGRKTFDGRGGITRAVRSCDGATPASDVGAIVDCTSGGVLVFIGNATDTERVYEVVTAIDGGDPVLATIAVPAAGPDGMTESTTFVEVPPGSSLHLVVSSGGTVELERTYHDVCPLLLPTAAITPSCATEGAAVVLSNPADVAVLLDVVVDGAGVEYHVTPFGSLRIVVPVGEDRVSEIVVRHDGATLASEVVERDCEQPVAATSLDCANQAVAVVLTNTGENTSIVSLDVDGATVFTVPIEPGDVGASALLPLVEDRATRITVTHRDHVLSDDVLTLDCERPRLVATTADCATGRVVVTVANDGSRATTVDITKNGTPATSIDVPPGATTSAAIAFAEDERATLALADENVQPIEVVLDCVEVQAAVVEPASPSGGSPSPAPAPTAGPTLRPSDDGEARVLGVQIARTGSEALLLTEIASLLLGLGGALLVIARRTA